MSKERAELQKAEAIAAELFEEIIKRNLIKSGITEKELNNKIYDLAEEVFNIKKYWHKRIVRVGENTLHPYDENPPNIDVQKDDILFLDFGPIIEDYEADYGRTYVLGNDPIKKQLAQDTEKLWHIANNFYKSNLDITGSQLYKYCVDLAEDFGWQYGGPIAGHLIGHFPHEQLDKEDKTNYIHPENHTPMSSLDRAGRKREWIIEIHLIDKSKKIGGFFEQLAG